MFIAALFSVAKGGSNPDVHGSLNGWIKYGVYTYDRISLTLQMNESLAVLHHG